MSVDKLELEARKAAVAACAFVAADEPELATDVLTMFLMEADMAGHLRCEAMGALVGQLISVAVHVAPPGSLPALCLLVNAGPT